MLLVWAQHKVDRRGHTDGRILILGAVDPIREVVNGKRSLGMVMGVQMGMGVGSKRVILSFQHRNNSVGVIVCALPGHPWNGHDADPATLLGGGQTLWHQVGEGGALHANQASTLALSGLARPFGAKRGFCVAEGGGGCLCLGV